MASGFYSPFSGLHYCCFLRLDLFSKEFNRLHYSRRYNLYWNSRICNDNALGWQEIRHIAFRIEGKCLARIGSFTMTNKSNGNKKTESSVASLKEAIPSILFYVIAIASVFILDKINPSGPCAPGGGILLLFLLPFISLLLLIINYIQHNKVLVYLHLLAIVILAAIIFFS